MAIGEELGGLLDRKVHRALSIGAGRAKAMARRRSSGKGAKLEHAAAILHPKMGAPVRKVLGKGAALIPSAKKMGGPGTAIDVPLGHKDAAYVRSHFDAIEVRVADAPRGDEIVVGSPSPTGAGRCPASAAWQNTRSRAWTGCGRRSTLFHDLRNPVRREACCGLRPMRTMPSIITMPMPGRSPIPIA